MSDTIQLNNTNTANISHETEDGEIEEINTNSFEPNENNREIDEYYIKLKNIGIGLRCSCCREVYSDPVKLNCDHLIDRFCISNKIKSNIIICPTCQKDTYCEDVDDLLTDFDIAAQIPPKPNALIELINKHGRHSSEYKKLKLESTREVERNDISDDGYDLINGIKVKKEKTLRRRRKTRWSAIDESKDNKDHANFVDPQATFTGVISDILASHNIPKNITISQFKKYTEISSKSEIMNLLTEVVMQNTKVDSHKNEKKSHSLSDKEILEMIPVQELEDLFDLEKIQLILLYREALDKGVLLLPSQNKSPGLSSSSKQALLPTPKKTSSSGSVESNGKSSPTSSRKRYTSESSKSSNISYRSSIKSMMDSSDSESASDIHSRLPKRAKHRKSDKKPTQALPSSDNQSSIKKTPIPSSTNAQHVPVAKETCQKPLVTSNCHTHSQNTPSSTSENIQVNSVNSKTANDCQKICDNIRYREDINRLHALYSTMYHASLKMKDFEHRVESEDYQSSYKTYCENYTEYQHLYSSLQSVINIDSISADKPDSISNSYTNSDAATPLVNGINVTLPAPNQEQASSTISPAFYAPDSTDSIAGKSAPFQNINTDIKTNIQNNLTNYRQFKKENSIESKKKFGYLWISNLSKDVRTSDLCKVFGKFGHISKIKLFQYKAQIPPTYFGLVFMPNYNEAENAVLQLQNKILSDKQIQIKMLCPNSDSINKTN